MLSPRVRVKNTTRRVSILAIVPMALGEHSAFVYLGQAYAAPLREQPWARSGAGAEKCQWQNPVDVCPQQFSKSFES